jgi:hypothetical protein
MPLVDTLFGAVVASVVGLASVQYQIYKEKRMAQERWDSRLKNLLERIDTESVQSVGEAGHERSAFYRTADEVGSLLEEHISKVDRQLSEETTDSLSELKSDIRYLGTRSKNRESFVDAMEEIGESAEQMKEAYFNHTDR